MDLQYKQHFASLYKDTLLNDILPFWTTHSVDRTHGGFTIALGRDGSVIDTDKGVWQQARFTWLLGTLYNTVEQRPEWLELAQHGIDFLEKHAFDKDGRMFFQLTQEGKPLRKRRYVYSEAFGALAFAEYARATGSSKAAAKAIELFDLFNTYTTTPGLIPPKIDPMSRPMTGLGTYMISINLAQILREAIDAPNCTAIIDRSIETITRLFMKPEHRAVLETVGPNGEIIDHFDGRIINPGHAIEAAWFILHEAKVRNNDPELIQIGTQILEWMWERGWDTKYGGLFYFRDIYNVPVQEYWQDMKFWWPHNEAIIATLLAYTLTNNSLYKQWHTLVHDWSFTHFPDPEFGEWYGYLHRDGRISVPLKGNLWKGPFHLPRMLLYCWQLLE